MTAIVRPPAECDIENLVGFFEVKFKDHDGRIYGFPTWDGGPPLDLQGIADFISTRTIYTFNGTGYDLPILTLALHGADHTALKAAGDAIIVKGLKWWDFYARYNIRIPDYIDHVDVMEVAAGVRIGLKMYAGRMHAPKMQDLPVDPTLPLPPPMRVKVSNYCDNDLEVTRLMREQLAERLDLRQAISAKYGKDVRSKSDAQIAETVIKAEVIRMRKEAWRTLNADAIACGAQEPKFYIDKRYIPHGFSFMYDAPSYLRFATPQMQEVFNLVRTSAFVVTDKEEAIFLGEDGAKTGVQIPKTLKGKDIVINQGVYRLGIGGLHSQESSVCYVSDDEYTLIDIDVRSYYPSLILLMGMFPDQLGECFLEIYRAIYTDRLFSKDEAERIKALFDAMGAKELFDEFIHFKTEADGLKIVLNGTFGKLFSKHSVMYAPELGIRVTMSGQLSLLMLIEMMEMSGIQVVSANTDGIVLRVHRSMHGVMQSNVQWWERVTGLEMEESRYKAIYFRDVNNYVAFTDKGKVKRKGIFAVPGLNENKHPDKQICADAVVEFLATGRPLHETITACTDIRKFIQVRAVKGGGQYVEQIHGGYCGPVYLGKAVRWYYGTTAGHIEDAKSGNQVAGSNGATPVMQLPESMPSDVNYDHYIRVAWEMLADIGIPVRYWHVQELDEVFIALAHQDYEDQCVEITAKRYEKLKG